MKAFIHQKKKKEGKFSTVMEILLSVSVGFLHSSCRVGKIHIYTHTRIPINELNLYLKCSMGMRNH